ncbi:unnamed protein product [Rotaria magnacalcarata]
MSATCRINRFGDIDTSNRRRTPVSDYRSEKLVSFEKALEPIVPYIDQLPLHMEKAKRCCRFPSEHGLTQDQSAAVYIYTMEWDGTTLYRVLNNALRSENELALKMWFPYLQLFNTALDKLPTVKQAVWRGVPLDIGKNFIKDQIVTWWSINSCSSSPKVIKTFLGKSQKSTLFLVEAINGKNVSGYTEFENEDEVILRIGTKFRVQGDPLFQSNGSYIVHLIAVEGSNDQPPAASNNTDTSLMLNIPVNARWAQNSVTVAGGNGKGSATNQLYWPYGLFIDKDQTVIIADCSNHRILQWKTSDRNGQVVAGGNNCGDGLNQLHGPTDVLIDKETDNLILCDELNRRVVQWSRHGDTPQREILIDNIKCWGLAMDDQRYLYVSDTEKHEVRRYQLGEKHGTLVAGGNGQGSGLNQLKYPTYLFVDRQQNVYVADNENHRVMKWNKGAKEGTIVAGSQHEGNSPTQLSGPYGIFVDARGTLYVSDSGNNRVMRWPQEAKRGTVLVGGNSEAAEANQLNAPVGLSFDQRGNLYVVDCKNHRVQRFSIE